MSTFAADDHEAIRRRMEELAAEKNLALTGSSAPAEERAVLTDNDSSVASGYGYAGLCYNGLPGPNPIGATEALTIGQSRTIFKTPQNNWSGIGSVAAVIAYQVWNGKAWVDYDPA